MKLWSRFLHNSVHESDYMFGHVAYDQILLLTMDLRGALCVIYLLIYFLAACTNRK